MAFSNEEETIIENFFLLKEKKHFNKALKLLDLLKPNHGESSVLYGLYGSIFYEINDYKNSAINFSKVISVKPRSELASLALFHSLVYLGKDRKALKELFRYTVTSKPKLHTDTIKLLMKTIDTIGFNSDRVKIQNLYKKWCSTDDVSISSKVKVISRSKRGSASR